MAQSERLLHLWTGACHFTALHSSDGQTDTQCQQCVPSCSEAQNLNLLSPSRIPLSLHSTPVGYHETPDFTLPQVPGEVGLTVLSNSPILRVGMGTTPGSLRHSFHPTPPMPTYLLAVAAGNLVAVKPGLPLPKAVEALQVQAWVVPGREGLAAFSADVAVKSLAFYTAWTGIEQPLTKVWRRGRVSTGAAKVSEANRSPLWLHAIATAFAELVCSALSAPGNLDQAATV